MMMQIAWVNTQAIFFVHRRVTLPFEIIGKIHYNIIINKKRKDIKTFLVDKVFEDDHLDCAIVYVNGILTELWHYDTLGFLDYWQESDKAFADLKEAIQSFVQGWKDDNEEE